MDIGGDFLYNSRMRLLASLTYRTLRLSERFFKTDMVYLAGGGAWLVGSQIVVSLVSLGLSIAFANLLPVELYGKYRYIFTIFNFLAIPTLTGINVALIKAAAQKMEGSLLPAFRTRFMWGMLSTLAGLCVAGYYLYMRDFSLGINIAIVSVLAPFFYSCEVYSYYLRGKKNFKRFSLYHTLSLTIPALTVTGALLVTDNLTTILICYFIPYTVLKGIFLAITLKQVPAQQTTDPTLISYGVHLSFMGVLGAIAQNIDKFLLWHFLGATQLAIYSLAVSPVSNLEAIVGKLDHLIFPKIAERSIDEIRKTIYQKTFKIFIVVACVVAVYIALAPYLYPLVFPKYLESIKYSQVYALIMLVSLPLMIVANVFTAHAKIKEKYYLSIIGPTVKISLFILLIPRFGIWGLIMSLLGFHIVNASANFFLFRKLA